MCFDIKLLKSPMWRIGEVLVAFVLLVSLASVFCGCSTQEVTPRGQTTSICAIGLPAVAWIMHTDQSSEQVGSDTNIVTQANQQSVATDIAPKE